MEKMSKPRVMIVSPTPGTVTTVYMKTILATMNDLATNGIYCQFETFDGADLPLQRNILATRFYESDCTHMFGVDRDMMFRETLCRTMLDKNKQMIGTVYAGKQFDFSRVADAVRRGISVESAASFASDWFCYREPGRDFVIENGLLDVDRVGFGVVLLTHHVLDLMISRGGVRRQKLSNHALGPYYNFFAVRAEVAADNQHASEDISFCDRWRIDCGGEIWALVDAPVYHVGDFAYGGSYFDHLQAINKINPRSP